MTDMRAPILAVVVVFIIGMSITSFLALKYLPCFSRSRRHSTDDKLGDLEKQSMESFHTRPDSPVPALHLTCPEGRAMLMTMSERGSGAAFLLPIEKPNPSTAQ